MTIKRNWIIHVPFFGDFKRSKVLNPGYAEMVKYRTQDDEGKNYLTEDAVLRVLSEDQVLLEVLIDGTIEEGAKHPEKQTYSYPPDYPWIKMGVDKGIYRELVGTGEDINTHFPDIYAGERDELYQAGGLHSPRIEITWEPTLPPQARK